MQHTAQVAIADAGPVGLMIANYLGQMGINVLLVKKPGTLIDYPRAISTDDESLRMIQAVGLVNDALPHTTSWHAMRFLTPKGHYFTDVRPMTDELGWSRRNAFIQPWVDAMMCHGLQHFPQVRCLFSREVKAFSQNGDSVTLNLKGSDGEREMACVDRLVACDGGASFIRHTLSIPFESKTAPNQWIVINIVNDPLATPHVYLCCDPVRPYVSTALPRGVCRFEFMMIPGEAEAQLSEPYNMRCLLSKVLPDLDRVELIRRRVYIHSARFVERFRIDQVLLAGDVAHIMLVWQGQGYNSGMCNALNLVWKLTLAVNGKAGRTLLDSYQQERRDHAKAITDLSVTAGNVLALPKHWQGVVRDDLPWLPNYLPSVKRYLLEMRSKPIPQYRERALLTDGTGKTLPVDKMFTQPQMTLESGESVLLDEVIGVDLAIIDQGCNPRWGLDAGQTARWRAIGVCFTQVMPAVQIHRERDDAFDTPRTGDTQNRLKSWFAQHNAAIAVVRLDRFVVALAIPQTPDAQLIVLAEKMTLTIGDIVCTEKKVA